MCLRWGVAAFLVACSGSQVAPDAGSDASATDVGADATSDASNGTSLPLGSADNVMNNQSCGMGGAPNCTTMVVHCPGIEDATAVLQTTSPSGTAKGTIFAHGGGGGTGFYGMNVPAFVMNGYRVVQVRWTSDWEKTQNAGILAAACRPATVMQWVFDNVQKGDKTSGFCAVGRTRSRTTG